MVGLAVLLAVASLLMVFTLFGQIGESLRLSRADLSWLVIITAIVGAVGSGLFPAVGSVIGQRRALVLATGCLALGSVLSALAPGFWLLMAGRVVASCGSGAAIIAVAVVREQRESRALLRALAAIGVAEGVAAGVGFGIGGAVETFAGSDWRAVFGVMTILAGLAAVLVAAVLPDAVTRSARRPDIAGALLLTTGLVALLLPVTEGGTWGWSSARVVGLFAGAGLALGSWVRRELRVPEPLVELRVLARRPVLAGCVVAVVVGGAAGLVNLTVPAFLAAPRAAGYGFGDSVLGSGLAMMPFSLAIVGAAALGGLLIARVGAAGTAVAGFLAEASGLGLLCWFHHSALQVILFTACFGAGHGTLLPSMYTFISGDVPVDEVGASAAIAGSLSSIASAVATAVVTALLVVRTVSSGGSVLPAQSGYRSSWVFGAGLTATGLLLAALFAGTRFRSSRRPRKGSWLARIRAPYPRPATTATTCRRV